MIIYSDYNDRAVYRRYSRGDGWGWEPTRLREIPKPPTPATGERIVGEAAGRWYPTLPSKCRECPLLEKVRKEMRRNQ